MSPASTGDLTGKEFKWAEWYGMQDASDHRLVIEQVKGLKSLKGAPKVVRRLILDRCELASLEGCPREVITDVGIFSCGLQSLKGGPELVGGDLDVSFNHIRTLEGMPKVVSGNINLSNNHLRELDSNMTRSCMHLVLRNNKLTHLKNIHKFLDRCDSIDISNNDMESNMLGLMLIKGLKSVRLTLEDDTHDSLLQNILNQHLSTGSPGRLRMLECQTSLHDNNLERYAEL